MLYLLLILTTTLYNGAVCLFIYWLCWVFIAAPRLSPVEVSTGLLSSCGGQASRCSGFSCEAWALQYWAQWLWRTGSDAPWHVGLVSGPRIEHLSPVLTGGF